MRRYDPELSRRDATPRGGDDPSPACREDLAFTLGLGVNWVALSFVQRPEDMDEVRARVQRRAGVLAKLEKPSAGDRLWPAPTGWSGVNVSA